MKLPARLLLGAVLVAAGIPATQAAAGQPGHCADRDKVLARLADAFGERRRSIGLQGNNAVIEVFASDETGTWTILMTLPNGQTCLVASGRAFEALADPLLGAEKDA